MGDINQVTFIRTNADIVRGPILEVGSCDYGSTPDFRSMFPGETYVGIDMQAGKGVDVVLDLTQDFAAVDAALGGQRFGTIICFSVLEHCAAPFAMANNITALLAEDGHAFISVPFAWKIHGYPSDYWRFTPEGVKVLFSQLQFDDARSSMATSKPGAIRPLEETMYRAELSVSAALRRGEYGFARSLLVRAVRALRLFPFIFDYRHLFAPVMVNMIGRKGG